MKQTTLIQQLQALGVSSGAPLMVHASMRKVGPIDGRGQALIQAIRDVIGDDGTMLMVLDADPDEPFDATTTPVDVEDMGILAELFRTTDGVTVNDHAAARFAALGPDADHLLHPIPLHDYFGPGSIFERFLELDGSVLRLGANIDTVTLTHYAEYLAEIPNKRRVTRTVVRADIGEQEVRSLDDTYGIVDWPEGDYFGQILVDFIAQGFAQQGMVGSAVAELLNARTFVRYAVEWMERNLQPAPVS